MPYMYIHCPGTKYCAQLERQILLLRCKKITTVLTDILVGVRSSASPVVFSRKDFDPMNKHKYSFSIFTASRYSASIGDALRIKNYNYTAVLL